MADPDPFVASLTRMGNALRRGHAAFTAADEAFEEALRALGDLTTAGKSMQQQIAELQETVAELKQLVMDQGQEIRRQAEEIRALRERLDGRP